MSQFTDFIREQAHTQFWQADAVAQQQSQICRETKSHDIHEGAILLWGDANKEMGVANANTRLARMIESREEGYFFLLDKKLEEIEAKYGVSFPNPDRFCDYCDNSKPESEIFELSWGNWACEPCYQKYGLHRF